MAAKTLITTEGNTGFCQVRVRANLQLCASVSVQDWLTVLCFDNMKEWQTQEHYVQFITKRIHRK